MRRAWQYSVRSQANDDLLLDGVHNTLQRNRCVKKLRAIRCSENPQRSDKTLELDQVIAL